MNKKAEQKRREKRELKDRLKQWDDYIREFHLDYDHQGNNRHNGSNDNTNEADSFTNDTTCITAFTSMSLALLRNSVTTINRLNKPFLFKMIKDVIEVMGLFFNALILNYKKVGIVKYTKSFIKYLQSYKLRPE